MEIAAWANRCYIITPHQKRRFPEKVDFRTSAGFLNHRREREAAKLRGGGPQAIVTDIGILEPDENGELILTALHPGRTVEEAKENTGWALKVSSALRVTEPPSERELKILREELDPQRIYLKGGRVNEALFFSRTFAIGVADHPSFHLRFVLYVSRWSPCSPTFRGFRCLAL